MSAASDPAPLKRAVSDMMAVKGLSRAYGDAQLDSLWKEVAGEAIARETKVVAIKRGVLHVAVRNAPLMGQLAGFHKRSLLQSLREKRPDLKLRDLKFILRGRPSPS